MPWYFPSNENAITATITSNKWMPRFLSSAPTAIFSDTPKETSLDYWTRTDQESKSKRIRKDIPPLKIKRSIPVSVGCISFKIKYFYLRMNQRISLIRSIIFSIFDKACTSILLLEVRWLALIKCALPKFRNNTDSNNFSRINLFPSKLKPEVSICIYSLASYF